MHRLTEDLELHFLELAKVKRKKVREMSRVERWCAILVDNLDDEEKEELAMMNVAYRDVFEAADKFAQSDKEYQEYLARESAILDYNTNFIEGQQLAKEEGERKGEKRGEKRGEARVLELIKHLQKAGRLNDLSAAMDNPLRREKLYQEFHID